ncbi:glutathione S-transferase family protein [Aestuariivirga litoralis]|uniref:glutathione S-transferase family protein n=1 Tax=Aestuariivirga litoralis TaxID=2650924 RepID=UPI0018C8576A|nr:glutathione S-transferase family protein [Aestuariivirga litoralis]MBG1232191.1 glutathione S-transferase family protein [Aestuariivirga litoralis]
MILIGQYDSPFVRRVAVTLHHYHMPFERKPLSVFGDKKEVQAINPLLRVPILILEDGEVLVDSGCIIDYLNERAGPARSMTPAHGSDRRRVLQACAISTGISDKTVALYFERHFHEEAQVSANLDKRLSSQIKTALDALEHQCGTPWFFDNSMTQADVTIGCMISHVKLRLPEFFPADKYPKLHALSRHCEMREEFDAARIGSNETVPKKL